MPFETPSLPVLINRTQADLASDSLRRSDAQVLSRALSGAAYGLYGYLNWLADQILPDKADEETLERIAALRLNQPRKPAQPADGVVSFSAVAGVVLDVDVVLQVGDGRTYRVTASVTTVAGLNTANVEAVDAGPLGNADPGVALTLVQPVAGVTNAFTVVAPGLTGGIARESIESLRARVIRSYRIIPQGGAATDYETWALEVPGITRAWCGAEVLTMFLNGDRSHAVVVIAADRRYRIKELKEGEVAIYTDEGDRIHFKRGRIIDIETDTLNIKAATAVNFDTPTITQTGRIVSQGDQVASGVSQVGHVHTNVQAGSGESGPPAAGG